jgi:hypothetical protein
MNEQELDDLAQQIPVLAAEAGTLVAISPDGSRKAIQKFSAMLDALPCLRMFAGPNGTTT